MTKERAMTNCAPERRTGGERAAQTHGVFFLARCLGGFLTGLSFRKSVSAACRRPVLAFVLSVFLVGGSAQAAPLETIRIEGNVRIQTETISYYLGFALGEEVTDEAIDEALKTIYDTGLFRDVSIVRDGEAGLVVTVEENLVIQRIAFEGNRRIEDTRLVEVVLATEREALTQSIVEQDVLRLVELYRRIGRYDVVITPKYITRDEGRVDLVYEIDEGDKANVMSVDFIGNEAFSDRELRGEISTRRSNFLSFLRTSDVYDPERLQVDLDQLRTFYFDEGYADFRILSQDAHYDRGENAFFISIRVDEGERYRVADVRVDSLLRGVDIEQLTSSLAVRPGQVYEASAVDEANETLVLSLSELGYAFARVRNELERDFERGTLDVVFIVDEGARVYIERIEVVGNTVTEDRVIRRELGISEGDAFNATLVDRAQRNLSALGFFGSVNITRQPGTAPDRVILQVDVSERNTGSLAFGASYSGAGGIGGFVKLEQRNLLGKGVRFDANVEYQVSSQSYSFSLTEPRFLDREVAARFSFGSEVSEKTDYDLTRTGGGISFSFPLRDDASLRAGYAFRRQSVEIKEEDTSVAIRDVEGDSDIHDVTLNFVYDGLDNPSNPTSGLHLTLGQKFGNFLEDASYLESTIDARFYREVFSDLVLIARGRAGAQYNAFGGNGPPVLDSFFFGHDLVRGFSADGLGPRDLSSDSPTSLGGTRYFSASAELEMPVFGLPADTGLNWSVFADIGSLSKVTPRVDDLLEESSIWDPENFRSSVGVSMSWDSPVGPIRFDLTEVLQGAEHDETRSFTFTAGSSF